jgi:hypothetical protein
MVAAWSVVTRSVFPYVLARTIGTVCDCGGRLSSQTEGTPSRACDTCV